MKTFLNSSSNLHLESIGYNQIEEDLKAAGYTPHLMHDKNGNLKGFRVTSDNVRVHAERTCGLKKLHRIHLVASSKLARAA